MKHFLIFALALFVTKANADVFSPVQDEQIPSGIAYNVTQPSVESPTMFAGKKVAILASHGVEESELTYPYIYLTARGAQVEILVPSWNPDGIVASRFLKPSLFVKANGTFRTGLSQKYDLIVLTGGAWNAQVVRTDSEAINLIRSHYQSGRPIAAICAGSAVLINAGLAAGVGLAGSPAIRIDLENAGAFYRDNEVVFEGNILSSRTPADLPAFVNGIKQVLVGK